MACKDFIVAVLRRLFGERRAAQAADYA